MKIVIAPDSFKGSLTANEVSDSIERGIKRVFSDADIVKVPMADGGEGTVQSLVDGTGGSIVRVVAKDPLMRDVEAFYGILGDGRTAVIEMASASGLPLLARDERNPMMTTTFGTGQLILHALDKGCRNLIIGIGGSATNDGGSGMLKALGVKLLDESGCEIGFGGGCLNRLCSIEISGMDSRIRECTVTAACDVDNPLCGPKGASHVFGPQKGADPVMAEILDKNLRNYAEAINECLGIDILDVPGAGAAGGLGAGLMAFLGARLRRGIEIVIDVAKLDEKVRNADLVITGEGMIDYQTAFGKTPFGVAMTAKKYNVPVIAIAGGIGRDANTLYEKGFDSIFSIVDRPMPLEEAMEKGSLLLESTAERIMRTLKIQLKSTNKY